MLAVSGSFFRYLVFASVIDRLHDPPKAGTNSSSLGFHDLSSSLTCRVARTRLVSVSPLRRNDAGLQVTVMWENVGAASLMYILAVFGDDLPNRIPGSAKWQESVAVS